MSEPNQDPRRLRRLEIAGFVAIVLLAGWIMSRGWQASILDRHDFRQVQTALSIHWLKETGFKSAYETPLFGPPWSAPMEYPLYQATVAGISHTLGTSIEATARAVGVGFLFATLPAVFLLAGALGLTGTARLWPVVTVLFAPIYLFYARTVMIETTALCFSTWFLHGLVRAVRDRSLGFTFAASVFAALAALAKITTFVAFAPAAIVLTLYFGWPHWRERSRDPRQWWSAGLPAVLPAASALAAALWWVDFSDALKEANPFARFLTSSAMNEWNWGTWSQRFDSSFWSEVGHSLIGYVFNEASLASLLIALACATRGGRRLALAAAGLFLAGPLFFANLYWRHDYYFCANAVFLLFATGFVLAGFVRDPRLPAALRAALPVLFFCGQWLGYQQNFGDYTRRELPQPPGIATAIRDAVPGDGVLLIYGWDWYANIPYHAQRRAIMVRNGYEDDVDSLDEILAQLAPLRVSAMLVHNPSLQRSPGFIRWRTERFGLAPTSLLSSEAGDLYVEEERFDAAAARLKDKLPPDVVLNVDFDQRDSDATLQAHPVAELSLPTFSPFPTRARALHGFVVGELDGQPTLMAHPVSELYFAAPPGAIRVVAELGLFPQSYAADASSVTDGVTFEVIERRPNGVRRVLLRRTLDPVSTPEDRGTQSIDLPAGPFEGELIFRTTPGPAGRFNNDWAYWGRIEIK